VCVHRGECACALSVCIVLCNYKKKETGSTRFMFGAEIETDEVTYYCYSGSHLSAKHPISFLLPFSFSSLLDSNGPYK
jgi:hypothetical protein